MEYTIVLADFDPERSKEVATDLTHRVLEASPRTPTTIRLYGYAGWLNAADEEATRLLLSSHDIKLRRGGFGPLMIPQAIPEWLMNRRPDGEIEDTDMLVGTVAANEETIGAILRLYGRGFSEVTILDERDVELISQHYNEHMTFYLPEAAFERLSSRLPGDIRDKIL